MAKKFTRDEFISRARCIHGDKYDYTYVNYINSATEVTIKCNRCGQIFSQVANEHLQGKGCSSCAGNKRMTTENFIAKARKIHGDLYLYNKVNYINNHTNIIITCPVHGDFSQQPQHHLRGSGCRKCYDIRNAAMRLRNTEQFVKLAKGVHGDKYIYDKVVYISSRNKVVITCPIHGDFKQEPTMHLQGEGCKQCGIEKRAETRTRTTEQFIKEAQTIHEGKYTYEHTVYSTSSEPIIITCPTHGDFSQIATEHLQGHGCPKCKGEACSIRQTKDGDLFIQQAKQVHGDYYGYDKVVYTNSKEKVIVTCPIHGDFLTEPNGHLSGVGCPQCQQSHGEERVSLFLKRNNILFEPQHKVYYIDKEGKKRHYKIDFFIPSKEEKEQSVAIEYNGPQHYQPIKLFGGITKLKQQQQRDEWIRNYCHNERIKLIEISYLDYENIENILSDSLRI